MFSNKIFSLFLMIALFFAAAPSPVMAQEPVAFNLVTICKGQNVASLIKASHGARFHDYIWKDSFGEIIPDVFWAPKLNQEISISCISSENCNAGLFKDQVCRPDAGQLLEKQFSEAPVPVAALEELTVLPQLPRPVLKLSVPSFIEERVPEQAAEPTAKTLTSPEHLPEPLLVSQVSEPEICTPKIIDDRKVYDLRPFIRPGLLSGLREIAGCRKFAEKKVNTANFMAQIDGGLLDADAPEAPAESAKMFAWWEKTRKSQHKQASSGRQTEPVKQPSAALAFPSVEKTPDAEKSRPDAGKNRADRAVARLAAPADNGREQAREAPPTVEQAAGLNKPGEKKETSAEAQIRILVEENRRKDKEIRDLKDKLQKQQSSVIVDFFLHIFSPYRPRHESYRIVPPGAIAAWEAIRDSLKKQANPNGVYDPLVVCRKGFGEEIYNLVASYCPAALAEEVRTEEYWFNPIGLIVDLVIVFLLSFHFLDYGSIIRNLLSDGQYREKEKARKSRKNPAQPVHPPQPANHSPFQPPVQPSPKVQPPAAASSNTQLATQVLPTIAVMDDLDRIRLLAACASVTSGIRKAIELTEPFDQSFINELCKRNLHIEMVGTRMFVVKS